LKAKIRQKLVPNLAGWDFAAIFGNREQSDVRNTRAPGPEAGFRFAGSSVRQAHYIIRRTFQNFLGPPHKFFSSPYKKISCPTTSNPQTLFIAWEGLYICPPVILPLFPVNFINSSSISVLSSIDWIGC
jgi:hypothetical protein